MAEQADTRSHATRLPVWARLAAIPIAGVLLLVGLWLFAGQLAPGKATESIIIAVAWFVVAYVVIWLIKKRWPELNLPLTATFGVLAVAVAFWFAWNTFRDVTVNEQIVVGVAASEMAAGAAPSPAPAPAAAGEDSPPGDAMEDESGDAMTTDDVMADEDVATVPPEPGAAAAAGMNLQIASGEFTSLAHGATGTAAVVELADGGKVLTFAELDTDNGPDLRVYLVEGPVNDNGDGGDFVDIGELKGNKGNQQYELPDDIDVGRFDTVVIWCRAFSVGFAAATLMPS